MSLDNKYIHCAIARLSGVLEALEVLLRNPLICNALVALGVLMTLRSFSRALSRWAFNNWRRSKAWTPERELVLLTGGCSGIGWQVMEDLASTGVRVVILDIAPPNFALPNSASFYRANVSSPQSIAEVAKAIRSDHGEPTILVNNAGVGHDGTILDEFYEDIRHTFEVNTLSHFAMVKEFAPSMVRANHGHIVTVASFASFAGMGGMVDYCCSNASALAFHEGLRLELRYWYKAPNVRTSYVCSFPSSPPGAPPTLNRSAKLYKYYSPVMGSYAYDQRYCRKRVTVLATDPQAAGGLAGYLQSNRAQQW